MPANVGHAADVPSTVRCQPSLMIAKFVDSAETSGKPRDVWLKKLALGSAFELLRKPSTAASCHEGRAHLSELS